MYKATSVDTDKALEAIEAFRREEILLKAKPILLNTDMVRAILDGKNIYCPNCGARMGEKNKYGG